LKDFPSPIVFNIVSCKLLPSAPDVEQDIEDNPRKPLLA